MTSKHLLNLGLGSSFNQIEASSLQHFPLGEHLKNFKLFYTGRHAIRNLLDQLQKAKSVDTIWLPAYYCQHVTAWLNVIYDNIKSYTMNPFDCTAPMDIGSFAKENDIVILNNFWGVYDYQLPNKKERPIYIEDHSHGWLSHSCLNSEADYCFASLRKTLPIPLGGIAWSPKNDLVERHENMLFQEEFEEVWNHIATGMKIKNAILNGSSAYKKQDYLSLINAAEEFLHHQYEIVDLSEKNKNLIESFLHKDYEIYKTHNLNYILPKIIKTEAFKIITPKNSFTFGLSLVFKGREAFSDLKEFLIKNNIYPSELWPDNHLSQEYKYLLNIHVDFRYGTSDMDYIAKIINEWIKYPKLI